MEVNICGYSITIDNEDYDLIKKYNWDIRRDPSTSVGMAYFQVQSNNLCQGYGITQPDKQELPSDQSDLESCRNMWKKLPKHRKTIVAQTAMNRAEAAII